MSHEKPSPKHEPAKKPTDRTAPKSDELRKTELDQAVGGGDILITKPIDVSSHKL